MIALVPITGIYSQARVKTGEPAQLTLNRSAFFPAPGAINVCPDTPLSIIFDTPPALGSSGKIQIFDAADNRLVESIEVGTRTATKTIGGLENFNYLPVIVSGNQASVYLKNGILDYKKTYYVTVEAGAFREGDNPYAGIDPPSAWRFTTKSAAPPAGTARLTVAADGKGDFCTVQGALDFIPEGNITPRTIFLRKGTYNEIICFTNKHVIALIGEDRRQSVITYANNANFNSGGNIYKRGVFLAQHVEDLVIANLSVRNTTPQGGSQAEAIILNGTTTARAILKDLDLYSYQDTLQINGQAYVSNCTIEGDVDFIWGTGPCFFENCVCRSLRSAAYYTQIRNPSTNHGYIFHHCVFEGLPGIMGNYLSRIQPARFPYSEVVLLHCVLSNAVSPLAWQFQETTGVPEPATDNIHFWEFDSRAPDGRPVDRNFRMPGSRELRQTADAALIADYSRPQFVLGNNWDPLSSPIFTSSQAQQEPELGAFTPVIASQPASQLALLGTHPNFTVAAIEPGRLTYRWSKNGTIIPGAAASVLQLKNIGWEDAAVYTVAVSNGWHSVESQAARLTVVAPAASPAPQLPAIPLARFEVTAYGAVGDGTTDNTAAIQKTIDVAVAAGGGIVVIPAADKPYLSRPLVLGSAINLQVDPGAVLQALPYSAAKPGGYPLAGNVYTHFITANNAHDVALTGGGRIDGQGHAWWKAFQDDNNMPHRPYLVRLGNCARVLVSGLTFTNSPMFHVALSGIDHLTVFGITVASEEGPNTDGLDPSGSHHLIQNCVISCGDDNIAMKPGSVFCSDINIADCAFGTGHGLSVGGQTNSGLDGMKVKNCTFDGTTSGLRLKADPTQGGPVQNISYTNVAMRNVKYPIVFYSYYNKVGNPGSASGSSRTTPEKARAWNLTPPNSLGSKTLPSWKNLTISNLTSLGSDGYSILWGLPLEGYFIDNVRLNNVRIQGGPGFEIFNATNIQLTGDSDVGNLVTANALAITVQPQNQSAAAGTRVTFSIAVAGIGGTQADPATYLWSWNGTPMTDGVRPGGSVVSGATSPTLIIDKVQDADGGKYTCTVTTRLDAFDLSANALVPGKTLVASTSSSATLTLK